MPGYEFTLVIEGDLSDESIIRSLFDAGCDDATFGVTGGSAYGEFVREGMTFADAVLSAVHQVDSVPTLRAIRIEPDDIVTMAEIAARWDRTRESVRLLISGQRGAGGFPAPLTHGRKRGRLWRWSDVVTWSGGSPEAHEAAAFTAAANAALELRHRLPQVGDARSAKEILSLVEGIRI